ncbi:MAG: hypothetical protein SNH01_09545 [Rikenellaceae bacterium]
MKKIIRSFFALTAVVATVVATVSLVSCSEGAEDSGSAEVVPANEFCNISISTDLSEALVSKADVSFTDDTSIGLAIYQTTEGNTNKIHSYPYVYNNIKATYNSKTLPVWYYAFTSDNWTESFPQISLNTSWGACKVYGYYPFISSVKDITAITYAASDNYAFMYGVSEVTSIEGVEEKRISMTLKQAMTRLHFVVTLANYTNATEFYYFTFETDATDKLVTNGTFNAMTGEITNREYTTSMQTPSSSNGTITTSGTTHDIYLVPFELNSNDANDDIKVYMRYENITSPTEYFTILEGNFEAGVSYTINVTIDNYGKIQAESIKVDKSWGNEDFDAVEL